MNSRTFEPWFIEMVVGNYVAGYERAFFKRFSVDSMQVAVQTGMGAWLDMPGWLCNGRDFYMEAGLYSWADESVDVLLMPHTLECSAEPLVSLAEAYRVLRPEGKVILTAFNPHSLWGASKWFNGIWLPEKKHCLPLSVLKKNAQLLGFKIVLGQFMVYAPPFNNGRTLSLCRFMEAAGNRWWPHAAAVYGLVLHKQIAGVHLLPEYGHLADVGQRMALGVASSKVQ